VGHRRRRQRAELHTSSACRYRGTDYGGALARRVVSDVPVTVLVVQSDDANHDATSSSGTMLLPDHAIGMRYMAMTYQQLPTARMADMPGARDGAGENRHRRHRRSHQVEDLAPRPAPQLGARPATSPR